LRGLNVFANPDFNIPVLWKVALRILAPVSLNTDKAASSETATHLPMKRSLM